MDQNKLVELLKSTQIRKLFIAVLILTALRITLT